MLETHITNDQELEQARRAYYTWDEYNIALLRKLFNTVEISKEYQPLFAIGGYSHFDAKVKDHFEDINYRLRKLESIRERLPLHNEPKYSPPQQIVENKIVTSEEANTVFIVHGREESAKETIARFIEKLTLKTIILHEQANHGFTILEKLECYSTVAFAIVLLTPDDVGALSTASHTLSPRARQNVVFELGYFIGKLGRNKVCALYTEQVELPSDFSGMVYIPFDQNGAWKLLLAKEIKAAGLDVDLNKAI